MSARRRFSGELEALETLRGDKTHQNQVSASRRRAVEWMQEAFSNGAERTPHGEEHSPHHHPPRSGRGRAGAHQRT